MSDLTPDQEAMLATWQQHTYAEFVLKARSAGREQPAHKLGSLSQPPFLGWARRRDFYLDLFQHPRQRDGERGWC